MVNTPEIRIADFSDPWDICKFSNVVTISTEMVDPKTGEFDELIHIGPGDMEPESGQLIEGVKTVAESDLISGKYHFYQDDIVYSKIRPELAKCVIAPCEGLSSADAYVLRGNKGEICQSFLYVLLHTEHFYRYSTSVSMRTGMPKINRDELGSYVFYAPSLAEQSQIGELIIALDTLITHHQRKCDELASLKAYLFQKIFPKDGERVPEIRFEGYSGDWEQHKVSDLLMERNEQAPMSDKYPLMAFIANEGVAPKGERYDRSSLVNDSDRKLYKRTKFGDFIYSSNNLETGSIGLNKYGNASISPVYSIFQPTGLADSDFIGRRFVRKDFINAMVKWRQGVVYGQWKIHESDFLKIEIAVPSIEEQRKIGAFLGNLDNLITLHRRKCDTFKELKTYLLQNMFPKED